MLVLRPVAAGADDLAKVPADITVAPGQTISKDVSKPMIGSAELRPDPDGCRNNPAIGLTCDAQRIKITRRVPGYFLRISTSWLSEGNEAGQSVPDADTYIFDRPTAYMDYNNVGGVSSAMPEVIKVVDPKQDEYDYVIGAYAGAIPGYTVVVQYVNESAGPSPAPADILLHANTPPITKHVTTPMVGYTGQPALYAAVKQSPDACRNDPTKDVLCDVYRIKLDRNHTADATNFVIITVDYKAVTITPDLVAGVAGVAKFQNPNLDLFLWDSAAHAMERGQVGGETGEPPERLAFVATQDEYDVVVQIANGSNSDYTLKAVMSDELFDKPFELLDPITGAPIGAPVPDGKGGYVSPVDGSVVTPPLALAPVGADDQIAGIGLGTTEQFDSSQLADLGRSAMRNTAAATKPPSAVILWLTLVVVPAALFASGVVVMRRRHTELI
jgi:hypothetical protein